MKKHIRLGLTDISISKPPIAEYHEGTWRIWVAYNPSLSQGTFISLNPDGKMFRVMINALGQPSISEIR